VTRPLLHRPINGDSGTTAETALRLEMVIGGSVEFCLRLRARHDLARIRNRATPLTLAKLARPDGA
jgi:plasmid maintenance system antidote protein VapI